VEYLSLGMTDDIQEVKKVIHHVISDNKYKNFHIDVKQKKINDLNFLDIGIKSKSIIESLKADIANALAQFILKKYEKKFIMKIIYSNYCYFNSGEKKEILKNALKNIMNLDKDNIFNDLFFIRRKNIISKKLLEYLDTSNIIILDGFITFRLQDYIKELEEVVDKAVDDYLTEKEYKEFIRLLKYFVDIQEPKSDTVHVLYGYDKKYILLDQNKREITNECIKDFINEVAEGEINYDDLLVSSLITLAPKKIYIHSVNRIKNKELIETIKNVFLGKVVCCECCELCSIEHKSNVTSVMTADYLQK